MAWIISGRDDRGRGPACVTYRWVDSQVEFEALIDRLVAEPRYALDTEFHRERTYFPKLALMQFAVDVGDRRWSTRWRSISRRCAACSPATPSPCCTPPSRTSTC